MAIGNVAAKGPGVGGSVVVDARSGELTPSRGVAGASQPSGDIVTAGGAIGAGEASLNRSLDGLSRPGRGVASPGPIEIAGFPGEDETFQIDRSTNPLRQAEKQDHPRPSLLQALWG